jgi:hypothetical protein
VVSSSANIAPIFKEVPRDEKSPWQFQQNIIKKLN